MSTNIRFPSPEINDVLYMKRNGHSFTQSFSLKSFQSTVSGKLHPQVFKELTTLSLKIYEGFCRVKGP